MKKFAIIATIITAIGLICSGMVASVIVFNQPKSPSMLSK